MDVDAEPSRDRRDLASRERDRRVLLNEMISCRPGRMERCTGCSSSTRNPEADRWCYTVDDAGFVPWCAACAERELGHQSRRLSDR